MHASWGTIARYSLLISVVSSSLSACSGLGNRVTGHTYFAARPEFQLGSPEYLASTRTTEADRTCEEYHKVGATLFAGRSTNPERLGTYFMPFGSNSADVNGAITPAGRALMPQNFNLFSVEYPLVMATQLPGGAGTNITNPFTSTISLAPHQTVVGVGFSYQGKFGNCMHPWLIDVAAPLIHVRNTLGFDEDVTNKGDFYSVPTITGTTTNLNNGNLRTMTAALDQSGWSYGKINNCPRTKTRLAFIQATAGRAWATTPTYHARTSVGFTLPTGNKPNAHELFEAIVGLGKHTGVIATNGIGAQLWQSNDEECRLDMEVDVVIQYLFGRSQWRSIDLKGKPWSRYIELYANSDQAELALANNATLAGVFLDTPGINILTQAVRVHPGFNATTNIALRWTGNPVTHPCSVETGYNLFYREAERVNLLCTTMTAAIKDTLGYGLVNPARDITNNEFLNSAGLASVALQPSLAATVADYPQRMLTVDDLDLNSAAHPAMLVQALYAAVTGTWECASCPTTIGLGGSYEFSHHASSTLNRWLIWACLSIGF